MNNTENISLEKILNRFELLKTKAEEDCVFSKTDFQANFENSNKIFYYISQKIDWLKIKSYLDIKYRRQLKNLYDYYKTEFALNLTQVELKVYIESDENYIKINEELNFVNEILNFIDSVIDILKRKSFEMKQWIEYQKFIQGQDN